MTASAVVSPLVGVPDEVLLGVFLSQRWIATRSFAWAEGTLRFRRWAVDEVLTPDLGARPLGALSTEEIERWLAHRSTQPLRRGRKPLAPATMRNVFFVLSQSLGQAVRWGLIPANPARGIRLPRASTTARVWTLEQIRHFLEHTAGTRYSALWRLMFATGLRRGEALGLRWGDVDWEAGVIRVERAMLASSRSNAVTYGPVKTARSRRAIALDAGTVEVLGRWQRQRESEKAAALRLLGERVAWERLDGGKAPVFATALDLEDPVFTHADGSPWLPAGVSDTFRRQARQAGLPAVRLHDIRHTHLTYLLRSGEPIQNVSARAGHASPFLTLTTYAHVIPGDDTETVKRAGAMFGSENHDR